MPQIVLRVRTQLGTWRVNGVDSTETLGGLRVRVEREHNTDLQGRPFTADALGERSLSDASTVAQAGLAHGDMIYALVDESKTTVHEKSVAVSRKITKDGHIVAQEYSEIANRNGFRPGMMPLRSMKMAWTLNEFISLDSQFEFRIKRQPTGVCPSVHVSVAAVNDFQSYMMTLDYMQMRVAYLYGRLNPDNSVVVEVVYEPPQSCTDISFTLLEDPDAGAVDRLAELLGLKKVGWIFSHPTREDKFHFSGAEIIATAEQQLEAAGGLEDTTFVTIKVTINPKGEKIAEAYQTSKQSMELVAEGALMPSANLGVCSVNPTFTAFVEGKPAKEVDNDYFLVNVPIKPFESETFVQFFPKANRLGINPSTQDIQRQLSKEGREGWTLQGLLADFHLLLFLCQSFSIEDDMPLICASVLNKEVPLSPGHELIIRSMASS